MEKYINSKGRNFGYGKQINYAAKNALNEKYNHGHFQTVASHYERFSQFTLYLRKNYHILDSVNITQEMLNDYAEYLSGHVSQNKISVTYAQNLLSSVNVTLKAMSNKCVIKVSPSQAIYKPRCQKRITTPG